MVLKLNLKLKALIIAIISTIICSIIFYYLHYLITIEKSIIIHPAYYFLILYLGLGFSNGFFTNHIINVSTKKNTVKFSFFIGLFLVFSIVLIELYFEYLDMIKYSAGNIFYLIAGGFLFFLVYSPILIISILGGLLNYFFRGYLHRKKS